MDVLETQLRQVLEGGNQYRVPLYQRPYSWTSSQLSRLWDDIVSTTVGRESEPGGKHFTGSLVLALGAVNPGVSEFLVVDGQQRLTTLSILLCAIRDYIEDHDPTNVSERHRIHETYLTDRFKEGDAGLKLLPTQADRDAYRDIVRRAGTPNADSGIAQAYRFFSLKLKEADDPDDPHDIIRILYTVLDGLTFVSITARGHENVYRIFESLNNTGMKLSQGDLLRNYVFMRLGSVSDEAYTSWWLPMQRVLTPGDLEAIFWMDYVLTSPEAKQSDIYALQQRRLEALSSDEVFGEVRRFSRLATTLSLIRDPSKEKENGVRLRLERLKAWGTNTVDPVVLHLLDLRDRGEATNHEVEHALTILESYLVRRLLVGAASNGLNRTLLNAFIDKVGGVPVDQAVYQYLSSGRKYFATDEQVRRAVLERPFYIGGRGVQRKQVLSWLEETFDNKERASLESATIEHVMPQTLNSEWRSSLSATIEEGETVDDLHANWVHTLGNLTLSAYNSELSNAAFAKKKELLASSGIRLNAEIAAADDWGPEEIRARGERLATLVSATWLPPLDLGEVVETGVRWTLIDEVVAAIPAGRWTTYGDLAALAGSHPVPVGQHMASESAPLGAWRVLSANGTVSKQFRWPKGWDHEGDDPQAILEGEGVKFASGRADTSQRLAPNDLAALVDIEFESQSGEELPGETMTDHDRRFFEQLSAAGTAGATHGAIEMQNEWAALGGRITYGQSTETSCFFEIDEEAGAKTPIWPIVIYPKARTVEVVFQWMKTRPPFDSLERREELRSRLSAIRGIELPASKLDKRPSFSVEVLADAERRREIVEVLRWFVDVVTANETESSDQSVS